MSSGDPDYIKTWRGQRYMMLRCRDCKRDFYEDASSGIPDTLISEDSEIDDEDELRSAEEALKRQMEDEDDRRFR